MVGRVHGCFEPSWLLDRCPQRPTLLKPLEMIQPGPRGPAADVMRNHIQSCATLLLMWDFHEASRVHPGSRDRGGVAACGMPVQAPTKYDLVTNLKMAKGLGIAVAPSLLARADEVIE
jgi:hypothetical protein